jgi:uncharacterized protein (TIRG00374 family)
LPKTRIKTLLGLALSLACLAYVLRELDFAQLWSLAREVSPLYVLALNALYALSLVIRTWRWQALLRPVGTYRFAPLFSANLIGFMANNLLPARVGEVVRAWTGARLAGLPVSTSLATIVVERMLDVPVLLAFLFLVIYFLEPGRQAEIFSREYLHAAGVSLAGGYLAILAIMAAVLRWPRRLTDLLAGLAGRIRPSLEPKARRLLASFTQGLATLGQGRALLNLLGLSVLVRVPILAMHYCFLPAVGLPQTLFMAAMAALGHGLALTLPAGPGYIGTYQLGVFWALLLAGAPREPALAYAVIFWAVQYFPLVIVGLIETYRHGLALTSLRRQGEELANPDQNA